MSIISRGIIRNTGGGAVALTSASGITEASADSKYIFRTSANSEFLSKNVPGTYDITATSASFKISAVAAIQIISEATLSLSIPSSNTLLSLNTLSSNLQTDADLSIEALSGSLSLNVFNGLPINIGSGFGTVNINGYTYPLTGTSDPDNIIKVSGSSDLKFVNARDVSFYKVSAVDTASLSANNRFTTIVASGNTVIVDDGWKPGYRFEIIAAVSGVWVSAGSGITINRVGGLADFQLEQYAGATLIAQTSTSFLAIGRFI